MRNLLRIFFAIVVLFSVAQISVNAQNKSDQNTTILKGSVYQTHPMTVTGFVLLDRKSGGIGLLGFLLIVLGIYFFPTIVAGLRDHQNAGAIFVMNLFLGWTFLGWVGSLIWSCTAVRKGEK